MSDNGTTHDDVEINIGKTSGEQGFTLPLTKADIKEVIEESAHPDKMCLLFDNFKETSHNFYEDIAEPISISLAFKDLDPSILKDQLNAYGFDAVVAAEGVQVAPHQIIVDDTGVRLPFMPPKEAMHQISAVVEAADHFGYEPVGYALPVVDRELCRSTNFTGREINVLSELDENTLALQALAEKGQTPKTFLEESVKKAFNTPKDEQLDISSKSATQDPWHVYRGGTLGNNPYAVVAGKRNKDVVYASYNMNTATSYASGLEAGYTKVDSMRYGFIYEYEVAPGQKGYGDFGIEYAKEVSSGIYETPIFPHRNKCSAIYLYVEDTNTAERSIIPIADENGYLSKEWETFAALHEPRTRVEGMKQWTDVQKNAVANGNLASYQKAKEILENVDFSSHDHITLKNPKLGENVKLPDNVTIVGKVPQGLDLSKVQNLTLQDAILGENVKLPENVTVIGMVPEGSDLSQIKNLAMKDVQIDQNVKLPANTIFSGNVQFNGASLENMDLSQVQNLTMKDVQIGDNVKLPAKVDFSGNVQFNGATLENMDLSRVKNLTLQDVQLGKDVKLADNVTIVGKVAEGTDLSGARNLTLQNVNKVGENVKLPDNVTVMGKVPEGTDLSQVKKLTLEDVQVSKDVKLPDNVTIVGKVAEGSDLSRVENLTLQDVQLSKDVKLPDNLTINGDIASGTDLSSAENLVLKNVREVGENVKLPKNVTFNNRLPEGVDLSGVENLTVKNVRSFDQDAKFDQFQKVTIEGGIPKGADLSEVRSLTLKDAYGDENVKLPQQVRIEGEFVSDLDLSQVKNLTLDDDVLGVDNVVLPSEVTWKGKKMSATELLNGGDFVIGENVRTSDGRVLQSMDETRAEEIVQKRQEEAAKAKTVAENVAHEESIKPAPQPQEQVTPKSAAEKVAGQAKDDVAKIVAEKSGRKSLTSAVSNGGRRLGNALSKANNAIDNAIDKTIEKGSKALNNTKVGQAYMKTAEKVSQTAPVRAVSKVTQKAVQKAVQTKLGQSVVKVAAKATGKGVVKSALKKIPFVSFGAGCYFAYERIKNGEWKSAFCEVASGAAGCLPGLGTAASCAIDAGLIAKDISTAVKEQKTPQKQKSDLNNPKYSAASIALERSRQASAEKNAPTKQQTQTKVQTTMLKPQSRDSYS